ncbi:AEC family transporter [Salipiger sp. P9]|uniref:AEC family transporter n=1 Tax=Salipiger pentaromativorans TaxID=2943193 RepID=UPI002157CDF2|nr:AEC family transporter [Salipiger pentaromativorans]MCR8547522.1 AEC family transporter [Salipiger pentaromativorans]
MSIVNVILPVISLIALGWIAIRSGYLSEKVESGLLEYVFSVAVPALILLTLARPFDLAEISASYLLAYFIGVALAWSLGLAVSRRALGLPWRASVLCGFSASQSNTVLLGVPLILQVWGDQAQVPMFLLLAVHLPIMMTAVTLLVEADGGQGQAGARLMSLGRAMLKNPIILAMILGLGLRGIGIAPGGLALSLLESVAKTTSTCALLAMGMSLARFRLLSNLTPGMLFSALKLGLHPLAVWVIAVKILALPGIVGGVAVLYAALPSGVNGYILAKKYQAGEAEISSTIVLSTLLSVVSITLWLHLIAT